MAITTHLKLTGTQISVAIITEMLDKGHKFSAESCSDTISQCHTWAWAALPSGTTPMAHPQSLSVSQGWHSKEGFPSFLTVLGACSIDALRSANISCFLWLWSDGGIFCVTQQLHGCCFLPQGTSLPAVWWVLPFLHSPRVVYSPGKGPAVRKAVGRKKRV